jgi:glycosyltransferase involved in cell wall biosynthesis
VLLVHDVYPDVLVAAGVTTRGSLLYRVWNAALKRLLRACDRICVLGRDVEALLLEKAPDVRERVRLIPNWVDADRVRPAQSAADQVRGRIASGNDFVVMYLGNMGRTHDIELLLDVAATFTPDAPLRFVFIGNGAKVPLVEAAARRHPHIAFLGQIPRTDVGAHVAAADVFVIPFRAEMLGVSVPSRSYDVMAIGTPMLVVADPRSEIARVVTEWDIGWNVPPGDAAALRAALSDALARRDELSARRDRAAHLAASTYAKPTIMSAYARVLDELVPTPSRSAASAAIPSPP